MSVLFLLMLSLTLSVDENQVCLHTLSSPICSSLSERAQERGRGTRRRENGVQKIFPEQTVVKTFQRCESLPVLRPLSVQHSTTRPFRLLFQELEARHDPETHTHTHTHSMNTCNRRIEMSSVKNRFNAAKKKINLLNNTHMHTHNGFVCIRYQKTFPLFMY